MKKPLNSELRQSPNGNQKRKRGPIPIAKYATWLKEQTGPVKAPLAKFLAWFDKQEQSQGVPVASPKRKLSAKPKAAPSTSQYTEQVTQRKLAQEAEARSKARQKAFGVTSEKELLEAVKSQPEDSRKSFASRIKLGSGFRVFGKGSNRKKTTSFEAALLKKDDEPKPEKKKVSFAEAFVAKRKQA